uniref:Secreted protein n=1 Tax=Anopheles farauti TaxID=69004 RepID=A0A182Q0X9_9DIPT
MAKLRMLCVLFGVGVLFLVATASPVSETSVATADSTENSSEELNGMFKEVEEMCRNNNATDDAYKHVLASFGQTIFCGASTINLNQLVLDAQTLNNETRKTFFPRYCPQLRNGYSCIQSLVEDFEPCLDEDDFTIVRALVDIVPDALKLFCKNDGEVLFSKYKFEARR